MNVGKVGLSSRGGQCDWRLVPFTSSDSTPNSTCNLLRPCSENAVPGYVEGNGMVGQTRRSSGNSVLRWSVLAVVLAG